MRTILFLIVMSYSTYAIAGGYGYGGHNVVDTYDPETGLYIKAITKEKENSGFLSKGSDWRVDNVAFYNPDTQETWNVFDDGINRHISLVAFEERYKDGLIKFYGSPSVKNNKSIKRALRDKMLIVEQHDEEEFYTLWISDRRGKGVSVLARVAYGDSWHIDMSNAKIRVVSTAKGHLNIRNYDW